MLIKLITAMFIAPFLALSPLSYQTEIPTLEQADRERFAARYDKAAELYGRILSSNPRDPEAHYGRVVSLIGAKRAKEAYQAADEALRQAPQTAGVLSAAGAAAFRGGDLTGALNYFEAARKLNPQHPGALYGLAKVYHTMSKHKSSRDLLPQIHKLSPDDAVLVEDYANTLKGAEHLAALERALAIYDPGSERAKHLRMHITSDRTIGDRKLRELTSPYEKSTIKLNPIWDKDRRIWAASISLKLNGKDGLNFLLDTGASGVGLSPGAAKKAGLEKLCEEQTEAKGIGNGKAQPVSHYLAAGLQVGNVAMRNIPVRVFSTAQLPGHDGLIGADVFEAFLVTIDFPKMELRLDPRPQGNGAPPEEPKDAGPPAFGFTRVVRVGNHFTLPTLVDKSKDEKLFLIDTGAFMNVIDRFAARKGVYDDNRTIVQGVQGQVNKVSRVERVELAFAGFVQNNLDIISFDLEKNGDSFGMALTGIIGLPTLNLLRITLDYREGTIRLEQ